MKLFSILLHLAHSLFLLVILFQLCIFVGSWNNISHNWWLVYTYLIRFFPLNCKATGARIMSHFLVIVPPYHSVVPQHRKYCISKYWIHEWIKCLTLELQNNFNSLLHRYKAVIFPACIFQMFLAIIVIRKYISGTTENT